MTKPDDDDDFAKIIEEEDEPIALVPAVSPGCACEAGKPPCAWCSLSEAERERIRSKQNG
jgi:hypothetical protein